MNNQSGVTLISLLVGLLIGILCILAVLSAYRTIVKAGVESRKASTHDTQLQSGLTAAQMLLQNAGFGLDGSSNLLSTTLQMESKSVKVVLWRLKLGTKISCQGLADVESSNNKKRRFVLLKGLLDDAGADCNETANLGSFKWKIQTNLAELDDYSSDQSNPNQISFEQTVSTCTPFGVGGSSDSVSHPLIMISAQTSTQKIAGLGQVKVPVCIVNIVS